LSKQKLLKFYVKIKHFESLSLFHYIFTNSYLW